MSKNFDQIANVDITIDTSVVNVTTFATLLIVGPLPATAPTTPPAQFAAYESLDDVEAAGWSVSGDNADPVGRAAAIAFKQNPVPNKIYIAPMQTTTEDETTTTEQAVTTVTRAAGYGDWYAVCPAGVPAAQYPAIAKYIEDQEKVFIYTDNAFFDNANNPGPAVGNEYTRSIAIFAKETSDQAAAAVPADNNYANVAFAAMWFGYQSGSETTAFKTLAGIAPADLSKTEMTQLKKKCVNFYCTVGSKNMTMVGKVLADEYADIIRYRDFLKNDITVRVASLFSATPKIPYTDAGIALIHNQVIAALKAGQAINAIAEDEHDDEGHENPGFTTYVPPLVSIPASDRASRTLKNVQFKARLTGAIHLVYITGSLVYEM